MCDFHFLMFFTKVTQKMIVLRQIGCVKELKGIVCSQAAEQLHCSFKKDKHFLNQMTPVNHIFMFHSVIERHNNEKNIKSCLEIKGKNKCRYSSG